MLLSVIIVNYNVKYFVEQCVRSIYRSKDIPLAKIEVYVVDNCSKDGSVAYLKERFSAIDYPNFYLIANKRNVGFGRANNQAVARATGRYTLFLNPDTLLGEHTIAEALKTAESHPKAGAIGVRMLHTNGTTASESRRGLPTPWVSFCKMVGLTSLFPKSRIFGRYYLQYLPIEEEKPIDIVSGAFMLCPTRSLHATGLFDETFFMYGEDIDLSFRFLKKGFCNYYNPVMMLHYKGESTKKNTYRYVHVFYEAMLIFFKKHYGHYNLLFALPIKFAIIARACLTLLYRQCRFFRNFLIPHNPAFTKRSVYIGTHLDEIKQLEEQYGLNIYTVKANETDLPEGHLNERINLKDTLHVIYDLKDYSVERFLSIFHAQNKSNLHIGTYDPETGVLITGSHTYTRD